LPEHAGPQLLYHLYDGTIYAVHPGPPLSGSDDRFSLRVRAAYIAPRGINPQPADASLEDPVEGAKRAADLNARLAAWVYAVQGWRYGNFIVDPAEFAAPAK
jgi:hypothetical protein